MGGIKKAGEESSPAFRIGVLGAILQELCGFGCRLSRYTGREAKFVSR